MVKDAQGLKSCHLQKRKNIDKGYSNSQTTLLFMKVFFGI